MAPSELPSSHGKRRGTLIAVIVLLLLVVAGGAYALGSKGSDGTETSGRESADRGQVSDDQNAEPAPKTTESTKATTSSPSAPVLTTAPAPTVAPSTTVPGSFEVPPGGRIWVAMRLSVTSEADARSFAADIPGAYVFPTTGWASLTPDYWVVAVGTYGSSDEVLQYCRDNGLTTSHDCVALPVSMNPDDHAIRPSLENPSGTT